MCVGVCNSSHAFSISMRKGSMENYSLFSVPLSKYSIHPSIQPKRNPSWHIWMWSRTTIFFLYFNHDRSLFTHASDWNRLACPTITVPILCWVSLPPRLSIRLCQNGPFIAGGVALPFLKVRRGQQVAERTRLITSSGSHGEGAIDGRVGRKMWGQRWIKGKTGGGEIQRI